MVEIRQGLMGINIDEISLALSKAIGLFNL